jgi:transposase InsO family protein
LDNGGEYTSNSFTKFCQDHGIQHHLTDPYHPAQNGVAERKNRTLVEAARSMLQVAHMSKHLLAEVVATACYLENHFYTTSLNNITPYKLWTWLQPDLTDLQIFGCPAYSHIVK